MRFERPVPFYDQIALLCSADLCPRLFVSYPLARTIHPQSYAKRIGWRKLPDLHGIARWLCPRCSKERKL